MEFFGQTVIVTGGAVGIGRAVAVLMAKKGANVAVCDINGEKLSELKHEICEFSELKECDVNDKVLVFEMDVTDNKAVENVVEEVKKKWGKVDILVNNAALWRCWDLFINVSVEEWKKFLDVNIMGTVYFTKAVLPNMINNEYGRIINVASVAGVYGNANMVHYSTTKGAIISMTRALAKEVADKGITVNSVSPGSVSDSSNPDIEFTSPSELAFMGRTGSDKENAELIIFLASQNAGYISGQNIQIDGCRKKL